MKKDSCTKEDLVEVEYEKNGSHSHTAIGEENNEQCGETQTGNGKHVEEAEHKWKKGHIQQYLLQDRSVNGAIIPIVNVLHSMWSQVDITMNG